MSESQPNNPLHGVTLKAMLEYLVAEYGWERLGSRINIRCFNHDPSINSSLKFLRKTDWAREKVELLYVYSISYDERKRKREENAGEVEASEENLENAPNEMSSVWDQALRNRKPPT